MLPPKGPSINYVVSIFDPLPPLCGLLRIYELLIIIVSAFEIKTSVSTYVVYGSQSGYHYSLVI